MTTTSSSKPGRGPRTRFRRRLAGAVALGLGLLTAGGLYAAFAPQAPMAHAEGDAALVAKGEQLYNNTCITCHGANLQGVQDRGPSLIGVGDAAVYFQVSTGRMPLAAQSSEAERKPPRPEYDPATPAGQQNLAALGAFVQAHGGGPTVPAVPAEALVGNDTARGGDLFRLNCASCHNSTGCGVALSSGKIAPPLDPASTTQIYTAMLTGPESMPKFSDRQLTPTEKKDIIAYILSVRDLNNNPGGNPLGSIGPVSEGLIAFVVGLAGVIAFALWLGAKS